MRGEGLHLLSMCKSRMNCCIPDEPEESAMTVTEQIMQRVKTVPEAARAEVLHFVESPGPKAEVDKNERAAWSDFSLLQAMRGMESERSRFSLDDVKEEP